MEDRELILFLNSDPDRGWEMLFDQYAGLLHHIVRGVLNRTEDVEDVVSVTFTEAFRHWDKFDPARGSIKAYLATIAVRRAIDHSRRLKIDLELDDEMVHDGGEILDDLINREEKQQVLTYLDTVGEPDRSMIIERFFFRRSSKEMAMTYHLTPNTIDQRISRALRTLRSHMEGNIHEKKN